MGQRVTFVSDLSGQEIDSDANHAKIKIIEHPTIDGQRLLDATGLEASNIKGASLDLVRLEILLPDQDPESIYLELKAFDKLFSKGVDIQTVLEEAEQPIQPQVTIRRPGRPAGGSKTATAASKPSGSGYDKDQLAQIRSWANSSGFEVAERGRIKKEILDAYEAAHKS